MFKDGRLRPSASALAVYRTSGETIFGLDRKAGFDIFFKKDRDGNVRYSSPASYQLWSLLDDLKRRYRIPWNSKLGPYMPRAERLVIDIMMPYFSRLMMKYVPSHLQPLIFQSPYLTVIFVYSAWNGPGFMKAYASILSSSYSPGDPIKSIAKACSGIARNKASSSFPQIRRTGRAIRTACPDFYR